MTIYLNKNPLIYPLSDEAALKHPGLCLSRQQRQNGKYLLGVNRNWTGLVLIDVKAMTLWNRFLAFLHLGPLNGIHYHIADSSLYFSRKWQQLDLRLMKNRANLSFGSVQKVLLQLGEIARRTRTPLQSQINASTARILEINKNRDLLEKQIKKLLIDENAESVWQQITYGTLYGTLSDIAEILHRYSYSVDSALLIFKAFLHVYKLQGFQTFKNWMLKSHPNNLSPLFKELSDNLKDQDKIDLLVMAIRYPKVDCLVFKKFKELVNQHIPNSSAIFILKNFLELHSKDKDIAENFKEYFASNELVSIQKGIESISHLEEKEQQEILTFALQHGKLLDEVTCKALASIPERSKLYECIQSFFDPPLTPLTSLEILLALSQFLPKEHVQVLAIIKEHVKDRKSYEISIPYGSKNKYINYIASLIEDLRILPSLEKAKQLSHLIQDDWSMSYKNEINIKKAWEILEIFQEGIEPSSYPLLKKLYQESLSSNYKKVKEICHIFKNIPVDMRSFFVSTLETFSKEPLYCLLAMVKSIQKIENFSIDHINAYVATADLKKKFKDYENYFDGSTFNFSFIFSIFVSIPSEEQEDFISLISSLIEQKHASLNLMENIRYLSQLEHQERKEVVIRSIAIMVKGNVGAISLNLLKTIHETPKEEREKLYEILPFLCDRCYQHSGLNFFQELVKIDPKNRTRVVEITYEIMQSGKISQINYVPHFLAYLAAMVVKGLDKEILFLLKPFIEDYENCGKNLERRIGLGLEEIGQVISYLTHCPQEERGNIANIFALFKSFRILPHSIDRKLDYEEFRLDRIRDLIEDTPLQQRIAIYNELSSLQGSLSPMQMWKIFVAFSRISNEDRQEIFNNLNIEQQKELFIAISDKKVSADITSMALKDFAWLSYVVDFSKRSEIFSNILNCHCYSKKTFSENGQLIQSSKNVKEWHSLQKQLLDSEKLRQYAVRWLIYLPPELLASCFEKIDDLSAFCAITTPEGFQALQNAYRTGHFSEKGKERLHQLLQDAAIHLSKNWVSLSNKKIKQVKALYPYQDKKSSDMSLIIDNQEYFVHRTLLLCDRDQFFATYKGHSQVVPQEKSQEAKIRMKVLYGIPLEPQELAAPICVELILQDVSFLPLYNNKIETDAILKVENESFGVHKQILAQCSNYFKSLFSDNFKEKELKTIVINEMPAESMHVLLEYIYSGEMPQFIDQASKENFEQLLERFLIKFTNR